MQMHSDVTLFSQDGRRRLGAVRLVLEHGREPRYVAIDPEDRAGDYHERFESAEHELRVLDWLNSKRGNRR